MRGRLMGWIVVAAAAAGIAASAVGATAAPPDANLLAARAAARRIVALTPLPPGAVAHPADPSVAGTLSQAFLARGPQQVVRTRYWTVTGTPGSVSDYIYLHPPAGSRFYSAAGPLPPSPSSSSGWQEERSLPGQTGKVTSELLQVTTAPARGGGTAIRADAIILWRPTWEQVPAGARAARVRLDGFAQRTVNGAGLARLRALVGTSPVVAPGAYSCPAGFPGQALRVTFVDGRGRPLAHVGADSAEGCVWLSVTVGPRRGPALQNGWGLAPRLWAAGSLIHCAAAQLSVSVSEPSIYPSSATATITVRNVARAPCSLKGFPSIVLLTATGRRVPVTDRRMAVSPSVVTAAGHGTLSASVAWSARARRCTLPAPMSALIGVPGVRHRFAVVLRPGRHRLGPCSGRLGVSPMGWF
jgi:hypothetical protein